MMMMMMMAVVECSNIRIFEYKNSIRILIVLFEYLKLFEYSSIRIFEYSNIRIEPCYSLQYKLKAHAKFGLVV